MPEKLLFELSSEGKVGFSLPALDVPAADLSTLLPSRFLRQHEPALPQVSEREVVQHFVRISVLNHHVDKGFYPLGSCTMKYSPKIHEDLARLPGLSALHPYQPEETAQGALRLMHELSSYLCEIAGMKAVCLQPAAGAQGELTGLMMIRAYHEDRGKPRRKVLIPDSAHGTNPASVTISGYEAVQVPSNERGMVDRNALERMLDNDTAALMLTNPNTLGIFETHVKEIAERVHSVGALMYMDGANLNALLGITRPGDMGFDVVHFNLHKTFSTPHGGGGPGAGPMGVSDKLVDYLPVPVVEMRGERYVLNYDRPKSIGKISTFYGNFGVLVRAYVYIRMLGARGLRAVSENAIINANYLLSKLKGTYPLPYDEIPMHEFVISGESLKKFGVKTLDVAKRLLDFGFHAPTIYFPLIVKEALMIEPTETESKATLDAFAEALVEIAREAEQNPELVLSAPHATPVPRLDEARAAKELNVRYRAHC